MAGKKELSNEDKKAIAYDLYMNTQLSQKEICSKIKITAATFTTWKKKYDWEVHKQAFSITAQNIISNLMQKAYELSTADKINPDGVLKIVKSIEGLSANKVTISNIINVFKDFTKWEFERNPELAKKINAEMKAFVDDKINAD